MATVDELLDQVCREAGLDDASGSDEREVALSCLNRAYRYVCARAKRRIPSSVQFTAALDTSLATVAADLATLDSVWIVDADDDDRRTELLRVGPERLLAERVATGTPTQYAVLHGTLMLDAADTSTIELRYTARPTALVNAGTEASIAGVDPIYHENLLGTLALAYALEGNEGEEQRAVYYRDLASSELSQFLLDVMREGGVNAPRDGYGRWDTPAPRRAR